MRSVFSELARSVGWAQLNGAHGTIESWSKERGRYELLLASDSSRVALQPKNVSVPPPLPT